MLSVCCTGEKRKNNKVDWATFKFSPGKNRIGRCLSNVWFKQLKLLIQQYDKLIQGPARVLHRRKRCGSATENTLRSIILTIVLFATILLSSTLGHIYISQCVKSILISSKHVRDPVWSCAHTKRKEKNPFIFICTKWSRVMPQWIVCQKKNKKTQHQTFWYSTHYHKYQFG